MAQKESEKKIVDNEEVKNETEAQQTTAEASAETPESDKSGRTNICV